MQNSENTQERAWSGRFFRMPMDLIRDPDLKSISMDARVLYALMLDRLELSTRNGWTDPATGKVYICYGVRHMAEDLGCSTRKVTRLLRELEDAALIERDRRGLGQPDRIFVHPVPGTEVREEDEPRKRHSCASGGEKISLPEETKTTPPNAKNFRPNYTEYNQTKNNYTKINPAKAPRPQRPPKLPAASSGLQSMPVMDRTRRMLQRLMESNGSGS